MVKQGEDWTAHAQNALAVLDKVDEAQNNQGVRLTADQAVAAAQVHALLAIAAAVAKSSETPRP